MRTILAAAENHCLHDDIEILCPSISRENLQFLVQFLYKGSIPCSDNTIGNLSRDIDNKTVKIKICLHMSSLTNKHFIWKHNSRVFLQRQLWIVNYYVKSSSNNLSNGNIKTGVSREMIFQK